MTDATSPWRETGNTDLQSFRKALSRSWTIGSSPMAGIEDAQAIHDTLWPFGLTRLAAAMLWHETKNGSWNCDTAPSGLPCIPASNRNPFAMKRADGRWAEFRSYRDAALAWASRILDPNGPYAGTRSVDELVRVYHPVGADGNTEAQTKEYVRVVCREIDRLPHVAEEKPVDDPKPLPNPPERTWQEHQLAGTSRLLRLPKGITYAQRLIRPGQTNQRPGIKMKPLYYTQHETGNSNRGADAEMHANWLHNGAPGGSYAQVGFHFVVDDRKIIQLLPVDEVAWHAGDGSGPGNYQSIGCELCVNADRNADRAEANAAALAAGVMEALGIPAANLRTHHSWVAGRPGAHYCPEKILTRNGWNGYRERVAAARRDISGDAPAPAADLVAEGITLEMAKELFPLFDRNGSRTRMWLSHYEETGRLPRFVKAWSGDPATVGWNSCLEFADGLLIFSDGGSVWTNA